MIKKIYIYLATLIGLIMIIFGTGKLIDVGLNQILPDKEIVYEASVEPRATTSPERIREPYQVNETRRDIRDGIALLIVGVPVFIGYGRQARKQNS